jgi:hypothetical protein
VKANEALFVIQGEMLEIHLEMEPRSAKQIGTKIRRTPDGEEGQFNGQIDGSVGYAVHLVIRTLKRSLPCNNILYGGV